MAGLAARVGHLPLAKGFEWLSSTDALVALATASVVEAAAYYIPVVDHVLDVIAGPAAVVAGILASAATMAGLPPGIMWPVAIVGGGGVAGLTKLTSALVRAKSGLLTGGLANPVVSTAETISSVLISIAAVAIPIVCLMGLVLVYWLAARRRRT